MPLNPESTYLVTSLTGVLGLVDGADKFISFGGSATFIVRCPSLGGQQLTDAIALVKSDPKGWMKRLAEFQMALTASVQMGIAFSKSSNPLIAVLPDFPSIALAQIGGVISTASPSTSGGVEKGAYFLATTGDFLGSILASLAGWVKKFVGDALDTILPDGMKMDDIIAKFKAIKLQSMFAFGVTSQKIGFFPAAHYRPVAVVPGAVRAIWLWLLGQPRPRVDPVQHVQAGWRVGVCQGKQVV